MQSVQEAIQAVIKKIFQVDETVDLTRADEQFGDYAINVALRLSKKLGHPPAGGPREVAQQIVDSLHSDKIEKAQVAGPGFINISLSDSALIALVQADAPKLLAGKEVVAEYSDPNPFKVLHAGHLYTSVVGDAIANLLENAGATVHRVNFGGDVGLHVAKAMWGILKELDGENPHRLESIEIEQRAEWMAKCYQAGSTAYDEDEEAKTDIVALNTRVYEVQADNDTDSDFAKIYWTCRTWSYDYFNAFYARIGTTFEKYYPESETAPLGLATVKDHIGDVYEESDGAIVFKGEPHGLHTRVFINKNGLPTYEAKDVGLALKKWQDYQFDRSVIITGNDIVEYMKVVMKSLEPFLPEATARTTHLTHGQVKLAGGVKMSSRKGNFLRAVDVLDAASVANKAANDGSDDERVSLGAVKYSFIKQRMGGDIVYDPLESVSLHGNSGPYLQYAHARANSILTKATNQGQSLKTQGLSLQAGERSLVRKVSEYNEVVTRATEELMPHHVCTYLYELAQVFNRFYENNTVIGDEREEVRVQLVSMYASTLENGLKLLGIDTPNKM